MKSFSEYVKLAETHDEKTHDMSALFKIVRLCWINHNSHTRSFFKRMASLNPEIATEYSRLENESQDKELKTDRIDDKEVVVPSLADSQPSDLPD